MTDSPLIIPIDRVKRSNEARQEDDVIFCPTCASPPRLIVAILDSRKGKTVRMFECQCGEVVWDDDSIEKARDRSSALLDQVTKEGG